MRCSDLTHLVLSYIKPTSSERTYERIRSALLRVTSSPKNLASAVCKKIQIGLNRFASLYKAVYNKLAHSHEDCNIQVSLNLSSKNKEKNPLEEHFNNLLLKKKPTKPADTTYPDHMNPFSDSTTTADNIYPSHMNPFSDSTTAAGTTYPGHMNPFSESTTTAGTTYPGHMNPFSESTTTAGTTYPGHMNPFSEEQA